MHSFLHIVKQKIHLFVLGAMVLTFGIAAVVVLTGDFLSPETGLIEPVEAQEIVEERNQYMKVYDVGEGVRGAKIFANPVHYKDNNTGRYEDIDMNVEPSDREGYAAQVVKGTYSAFFKKYFDQPDVLALEFDSTRFGVTSKPLTYVDTQTGMETEFRMPQSVEMVANENTVVYKDAYGPGLDVLMSYGSPLFRRELHIDQLERLGDIPEGAEYIDLGFNFSVSIAPEDTVYVEGVKWDGQPIIISGDIAVESKDAGGYFSLLAPLAYDANDETVPLEYSVQYDAQGNLSISKRIPVKWLKEATYPIRADDATYVYEYAHAQNGDDVYSSFSNYSLARNYDFYATYPNDGSTSYTVGDDYTGGNFVIYRGFISFQTAGLPDNATVTNAYAIFQDTNNNTTCGSSPWWQLHLYRWTGTYPIVAGDFDAVGSYVSYDNVSNCNAYGSAGSRPTFLNLQSAISVTENTNFVIRSSNDVNSNSPSERRTINIYRYGSGQQPYIYVTYTTNSAPDAPTSLYANTSANGAQSGSTNPTGLNDLTPEFSAVYEDSDSGDTANKYCIQVATASDFSSGIQWSSDNNSCSSGTSITDITEGNRSIDIEYDDANNDGTADGNASELGNDTTYYWRIKFWDDSGDAGTWSSANTFTLNIPDTDGDGVYDFEDICPDDADPSQSNTDGLTTADFALYLPFDEGTGSSVSDTGDEGNDGTISGATWSTDDAQVGYALSFDGVNDYVEVSDAASLDITDEITLAAWVKTTGEDFVVVKDPSDTEYTTQLLGTYSAGKNTTYIYGGWYGGQRMYGLMNFDVSAYEGGNIESASLWITKRGNSGNSNLAIYPITSAWTEASVTNAANSPSYNNSAGTNSFSTASLTNNVPYEIDVTDIVQGWADGDNAYGLVIASTDANPGSNQYAWFYDDATNASYQPKLELTYSLTKTQVPYALSTIDGGQFLISSGGTDYTVTCSGTANDGNWHHLAATYDGSSMKIYLDGEECGSTNTVPDAMPTNNDPVWIGRHWDPDVSDYFNGKIDEVAIVPTALSSSTIASLYGNGAQAVSTTGYLIDDYGDACDVCPNIANPGQREADCVSNNYPTLSSYSASQISANTVRATTTISDGDSDLTSLYVEYSLDGGSSYASTTFSSVTVSTGTVSTAAGEISSIDTTEGDSIVLGIDWNAYADAPGSSSTVFYLRLTPLDATGAGSAVTVTNTIDLLAPTAAGVLTTSTASTTGATLVYGDPAVDPNFSFYKFYFTTYLRSVNENPPDGDLNSSGAIDASDEVCIALMVTWESGGRIGTIPACIGEATANAAAAKADMDCSGVVDATDQGYIQTLSAGGSLSSGVDSNANGILDDCEYTSNEATVYDTEIDSDDVSAFGFIDFNSEESFSLNGLNVGIGYTGALWAYDTLGRYASTTPQTVFFTASYAGVLTVTASSTNEEVLEFVISRGDNPDSESIDYAVCQTTNGTSCDDSYLQADGSFDSSIVWQTESEWGSPIVSDIWGGYPNTEYKFLIQSRTPDRVSGLADSYSAAYTLPASVSSVSATNTTTPDEMRTLLTFTTNDYMSGVRIDRDAGCNGSYDVSIYDSSSTIPTSPLIDTSDLLPNTCYVYKFRTYGAGGDLSEDNVQVTSEYYTPALPPSVTLGLATDTSLRWEWEEPAGADSYYVYNAVSNTLISAASAGTFTQTELTPGLQYSVYVRSYSEDTGLGTRSATQTAYTKPHTPGSVSATNIGPNSFRLVWNKVGFGNITTRFSDDLDTETAPLEETYYDYEDLEPNESYDVDVVNTAPNGVTSTATITVTTAYRPPEDLVFTSSASSSITVTAEGSFPNLGTGLAKLKYQNLTTEDVVASTNLSWSSTGLTPNTAYIFSLSAINSAGLETTSVTKTLYTKAAIPNRPTVSLVTDNSIKIAQSYTNPLATEHTIFDTLSSKYLTAEGTLTSDEPVWMTGTTLGASTTISSLLSDTKYCFTVRAKNAEDDITASTTPRCAWTAVTGTKKLVDVSVANSVTVTNDQPIITIDENDNANTGVLASVTIPADVDSSTEVKLRMNRLKVNNAVTTSVQSIQITRVIDDETYGMIIPGSTSIQCEDENWEELLAPTFSDYSSVNLPQSTGIQKNIKKFIKIGVSGTSCSFSKPVKLTLPGQSGNKAFYVDETETVNLITNTCNSTETPTVEADSECSIDSGDDLVIFTRHATEFGSYEEVEVSSDEENGSSGSSGGGGGSIGPTQTISMTDLLINGQIAPKVTNPQITISPVVSDAVNEITITTNGSFNAVSWQPFNGSILYTLPEEYGTYQVSVKVRSGGVQSNILTRTVEYQPLGDLDVPVITSPSAGATITSLPFVVAGTADAGALVSIEIAGSTYSVTADESGAYSVTILDSLVSGAYTLYVSQSNDLGQSSAIVSQSLLYVETDNENTDEVPTDMTDPQIEDVVVSTTDNAVIENPAVPQLPTESDTPDGQVDQNQQDTLTSDLQEEGQDTSNDSGGGQQNVSTNQPVVIDTGTAITKPVAAPSVDDVKQILDETIAREAFMLVLSNKTSQFRQQQVQTIRATKGEAVDFLLRPSESVHSITARLYPVDNSVALLEEKEERSLLARLFGQQASAATVHSGNFLKGYVFDKDTVLDQVYRGNVALDGLPEGQYRLVITLNESDGGRVHIAKRITADKKGRVVDENNSPVSRARVALHQKNEDGTYTPWNGDLFGQSNPVFTDVNGEYSLDVPPGEYMISVEANGYRTYESDPVVINQASTINRSITIDRVQRGWWGRFWDWLKSLLSL